MYEVSARPRGNSLYFEQRNGSWLTTQIALYSCVSLKWALAKYSQTVCHKALVLNLANKQFNLVFYSLYLRQTKQLPCQQSTLVGVFSTDHIWWKKSELQLSYISFSINHMTHKWGCYYGLYFTLRALCGHINHACHTTVHEMLRGKKKMISTHLIIRIHLYLCFLHFQIYSDYDIYYICTFLDFFLTYPVA